MTKNSWTLPKFVRPMSGFKLLALLMFLIDPLLASGGSHFVWLDGLRWDLKIEGPVRDGANSEKMLPITFSNGAKGWITSTLIVGSSDKLFLKSIPDSLSVQPLLFTDAYLVQTNSPMDALELSKELSGLSTVHYAHPDFVFPIESRASGNPDPYFESQWNLKNTGQNGGTPGVDIDIESAWAVTKGSPDTVVAVLDLGFEQNHKDMVDAWYVNPGEIPGNKKDDDGNGLIDDVQGWNFSINGNNLIYGAAPNHGTATAGIIGARANGVGIMGVCPECKILPIVVSGRVSEDASAIGYAAAMGASVLSNSWGYGLESPRTDVVSAALSRVAINGRGGKGTPILFAMRNAATNDCRTSSPDISAHPEVIAISSVDFNDRKVQNSGFGACLQFLGPSSGTNINGVPATDRAGVAGYNTDGSGNFRDLDFHSAFWGTSAATPQVAGLFALLLSHAPELTRDEALSRMRTSAIKISPEEADYDPHTGHSLKYGYGRASASKLFP
jgi:subtilisin family serine protease